MSVSVFRYAQLISFTVRKHPVPQLVSKAKLPSPMLKSAAALSWWMFCRSRRPMCLLINNVNFKLMLVYYNENAHVRVCAHVCGPALPLHCVCIRIRTVSYLGVGHHILCLISFHSRIIFCGFPTRILFERVSSIYMLASVLRLKCCYNCKDAALTFDTNACRQWCRRVRSVSSDWRDWGRPQNKLSRCRLRPEYDCRQLTTPPHKSLNEQKHILYLSVLLRTDKYIDDFHVT